MIWFITIYLICGIFSVLLSNIIISSDERDKFLIFLFKIFLLLTGFIGLIATLETWQNECWRTYKFNYLEHIKDKEVNKLKRLVIKQGKVNINHYIKKRRFSIYFFRASVNEYSSIILTKLYNENEEFRYFQNEKSERIVIDKDLKRSRSRKLNKFQEPV